jgi:DNA uptake protein ComE-like DNA-binding protein
LRIATADEISSVAGIGPILAQQIVQSLET